MNQTQNYTGAVESSFSTATTRKFLLNVYNWMAMGLAVTGVIAYGISKSSFVETLYTNSFLLIGIVILQLAVVMGLTFAINKIPAGVANRRVLPLFSPDRNYNVSNIFSLYRCFNSIYIFYLRRNVRSGKRLRISYKNGSIKIRNVFFHGINRSDHCLSSKHIFEEHYDELYNQLCGSYYFRRVNSL